jgi:DNA-binding transcriptional LysR family regulator
MYERLFAHSGLSLDRLRSFAEIIDAGGIMAAAEDDPNRQSQLSRQLRELERYFGTELLRRGRGPMRLTPAGTRLHEAITHALGALDACRQTCANEPVELTLGAGESLIQWLILPRLRPFISAHPRLRIVFENLRNDQIVERLCDGTLDWGVVSRYSPDKPLAAIPLGSLAYRLFLPADAPPPTAGVASGSQTDPAAAPPTDPHTATTTTAAVLGTVPLAVLLGSDSVRDVLKRAARKHRIKLDLRLQFSSYPQLASAVQHLGVAAIMPGLAATAIDPKKVQCLRLPELDALTRRVTLLSSRKTAEIRPIVATAAPALAQALRIS